MPVTYNQTITLPNTFDAAGVTDISDDLAAWIQANVPNGPSTFVHTRVLFPNTTTSHADARLTPTSGVAWPATTRAQYRVEGGAAGHISLTNMTNVTFDGGGGVNGAGGAQFVSQIKQIYHAGCSNALGISAVDGSTTKTDNILTGPEGHFVVGMVGAEIGLNANVLVNIASAAWTSANGGTITYTTSGACPFAVGHRLDQIAGFAVSGYNSAAVLINAVTDTTFAIYNRPNPGASTSGGYCLTTSPSYRKVTAYLSPTQLKYSGVPYGDWGVAGHAYPNAIRWTTLPRIAPPNWNVGTTYSTDDRVAYGGHVYDSLQDNNLGNTPNTSGNLNNTFWQHANDNSDLTTATGFRGVWEMIYQPTGLAGPRGAFTGSNANGDAFTQCSTAASGTSGSRQLFWLTNCTHIRLVGFSVYGTHESQQYGGGYDPNNETQNAFMWRGCTDCEMGNLELTNQWGNGFETFPSTWPDGSTKASIGIWCHDSHIHGFGRQTMSFQIGGNIIVERCNLHGSSRTLIDIEPTTSFSLRDVRLSNLVQDVHLYDNTIGHHGLGGIISIHNADRVHIKGNTGTGIGSGSTWVVDNLIYEHNTETDSNTTNNYIVFARGPVPAGGGSNLWVHDNTGMFGRLDVLFANSGDAYVGPSMAGLHTNSFTGTQSLAVDTVTTATLPNPVDTSLAPNAGRLYVGQVGDFRTWIDYNGKDASHYHNCTSGGLDRVLQYTSSGNATPIRTLIGCQNYRSVNNTSQLGNIAQYADQQDVSWAKYGTNNGPGVFVPFTVDPMPHPYRDDIANTAGAASFVGGGSFHATGHDVITASAQARPGGVFQATGKLICVGGAHVVL